MKSKVMSIVFSVCTAILLSCGCAMFEPDEEITPSDLTLEELQAKRRHAMDPQRHYATAKTTLQRQSVSTERFLDDPDESIVLVQFERPDKINMTTFVDNEPSHSVITNGDAGWIVTYDGRDSKTAELSPEQLAHIRLLSHISSPEGKLQEFFREIEVVRCRNDEGDFYKLICRNDGQDPVEVYIDANDYLTRRMRAVLNINNNTIKYDSRILRYALFDGVMVPVETTVRQNGVKQTSKVLLYRLDVPFKEQDFLPPAR